MAMGRDPGVAPVATRQASGPAASGSAGRELETVLRAEGIAKAFGATKALRDCSLDVRAGEVHVLMGENGSGKSTLVKILSGVHRPDAGSITISGTRHRHLAAPREAMAAGIATVFQEILVVGQQTVLANVWLGSDGLVRRRRPPEERRARASAGIAELIDLPGLDAPIGELNLNDRQAICIARALVSEPRLLILDEATSALDVTTRDNLFAILRRLRKQGVAILMISHRMDEVEELADRITVMRSGERVATVGRGEATARELVRMMTGVDHAPQARAAQAAGRAAQPVAIRASAVRLTPEAQPLDAEFRGGEIVGIAGLEGHGQDVFLQVLAGVRPAGGRVLCASGDDERELRSRIDAMRAGVGYVPRDRRDESLLETRSIVDNFGIASVRADRRAGLVHRGSLHERFEGYARRLRITAGRRTNLITSLSGGNQQKVVIARWMARHPRVLLLNDPTRGVDMGAKMDIYRILREAADEGVAVIMLSTELIELVELMDRVLVFRENELSRELGRHELTRTRLVASYFGKEHE
jgi:ABC-type sugar transport system ATPase subunit